MSKRLVVDHEPWRRTDFHFDESENKVTLNTVQDAEPIVDENKRKMNAYGYKLCIDEAMMVVSIDGMCRASLQ
jgi:hypothetical protein